MGRSVKSRRRISVAIRFNALQEKTKLAVWNEYGRLHPIVRQPSDGAKLDAAAGEFEAFEFQVELRLALEHKVNADPRVDPLCSLLFRALLRLGCDLRKFLDQVLRMGGAPA